jgi:Parvulin-like peptidyl-prolyl isomerase
MKLKRNIAALLCAGMLISGLAACGSSEVKEYEDSTADPSASMLPVETDLGETTGLEAPDYTYAFEKYSPETVVFRVNGLPITWNELFYWIMYNRSTFEMYFGTIEDWSAANAGNPEQTNNEAILEAAMGYIKEYTSLESNVMEMGVELTDEQKKDVEDIWNQQISQYADGDTELFINDYLKPSFLTEEMYKKLIQIETFFNAGVEKMFGEGAKDCTEEEVAEFVTSADLVAAKHILIKTGGDIDPDTGMPAELDEAAVAEKTAQAEDILSQIKSAADPAAKFDELMNEFSEDTGLVLFPEGYIFDSTKMVAEFNEGTRALEVGEISDLVESTYGYHIIMRVDAKPDMDYDYSNDGRLLTLREAAAISIFDSHMAEWSEEAVVEWEPDFKNLDLAKIFEK